MKNQLFNNLDEAEGLVSRAYGSIRYIHEHRNDYNYTVWVEVKHRKKVCGVWMHPKYTYHQETKLNQERFDGDLAVAHRRLQQAQQQLQIAESAIRQEISVAQAQVNYCHTLQGNVSSLQSQNNQMQSKLSHLGINSWNATNQVALAHQRKADLIKQKALYQQEVSLLPGKVQQIKMENDLLHNQVSSDSAFLQEVRSNVYGFQQILHQKLLDLPEEARAKLAYDTFSQGNDVRLKVIESCGFFTEKMAEISVSKGNQAAFSYCLNKGLQFDSAISEKLTLALYIIKDGNPFFMNHLFASGQELNMTIFTACATSEFAALASILEHDQYALQKFKEVEACGFGVVQYAIATGNQALIEFVANHDTACFKQEIVGHHSYFYMALTYNDPAIISLISQQVNLVDELAHLIQSNESEMFSRAIANTDLPEQEGILMFNSCLANGNRKIAKILCDKFIDIREEFAKALKNLDAQLGSQLLDLGSKDLTSDYISCLIDQNQQAGSDMSAFRELFEVEEEIVIVDQMLGQTLEQIQIDHF